MAGAGTREIARLMRPVNFARGEHGLFVPTTPALVRFLSFCEHDPGTGCVIWTGGTTAGRGHHARYGAFWYDRRRWFAHRWAAKHIHGLDIDDMQVDHCCPPYRAGDWLAPNTLCVEHVQAVLPTVNRELQWIRVQVGLEDAPAQCDEQFNGVPWYDAPEWMRIAA